VPSSPIINVRTRGRTTYKLDPKECIGDDGKPLVADDDYIIFKDVLTAGESTFLYDDLVREIRPDGMQAVRMGTFDKNKLVTWTVDWSFLDESGNRLALSLASVEILDPTVFRHLCNLCDKHTNAMLEKRRDPKSGAVVANGSKGHSGPAT